MNAAGHKKPRRRSTFAGVTGRGRSSVTVSRGRHFFLVLLAGGFFRSLQFTALNALCYADVPQESMSNATSFAAVGQQLAGARA